MADIGPASGFKAVTPHDSNVLPTTSRGIYVGTAGDLTVQGADGQNVTFKNLPAGTVLPIQARIVRATGTTASDIVAVY